MDVGETNNWKGNKNRWSKSSTLYCPLDKRRKPGKTIERQ